MAKAKAKGEQDPWLKEIPNRTFGGQLRDSKGVPIGRYLYIHHSDQDILDRFCRSWLKTYQKDKRFFITIDLETTGLSAHTKTPLLVSISWNGRDAIVFRAGGFNWETFREVLRTVPINNANLKFDAKFFAVHWGVKVNFYFDPIAGCQLGWNSAFPGVSFALDNLIRQLLPGYTVDKAVRKTFIGMIGDPATIPFNYEQTVYAARDAALAHAVVYPVVKRLLNQNLWHLWENVELPLQSKFTDIELTGLLVDQKTLKEKRTEIRTKMVDILAQINKILDETPGAAGLINKFTKKQFNPGSGQQLIKILKLFNVQLLNAQEDTILSARAEHKLPILDLIHDYRTLASEDSKFCKAWLENHIHPVTSRIHCSFGMIKVTGRMSCSDPNMQAVKPEYRPVIIASPGARIITMDLSQYEFRALGAITGEEALLDAFHERESILGEVKRISRKYGEPDPDHFAKQVEKGKVELEPEELKLIRQFMATDIHRRTGSLIFGVPPTEITSVQRKIAKTGGYAVVYGTQPPTLQQQMAKDDVLMSIAECEEIITTFYDRLPKVKAFVEKVHKDVELTLRVENRVGRKRYFMLPPKWQKSYYSRELARIQREAVNFYPQSMNADCVKTALLEMIDRGENKYDGKVRVLLQIHDEIVLEDFTNEIHVPEEFANILKDHSERILGGLCPSEVSLTVGNSWAK